MRVGEHAAWPKLSHGPCDVRPPPPKTSRFLNSAASRPIQPHVATCRLIGVRRRVFTRAAAGPPDDDGFSLIELMVTMTVMSIVMTLFTAGMVQLFSAQNHSDALTGASQQVHVAFVRLDRELRYSSGISAPGTATS